MTLTLIGVNHKTAPIALRERVAIGRDELAEATRALAATPGVAECMIVSTCNRVELIAALETPEVQLAGFLTNYFGIESTVLSPHLYEYRDREAVGHLFRMAASLDSMVVGEPQVVAQVEEAWKQARKAGTTGRFLDAVLQKALAVSKRARTETAIGKAGVSIPYAAVELARRILGGLEKKKVLLLGAGTMSELSARELLKDGGGSGGVSVTVISRTLAHAADLAAKLGGDAFPFEERSEHMAEADIIISATACPYTIVSREQVETMIRGRKHHQNKNRPLVILDIAMPRDVDAAVREVEGVFLYDLDDLENVTGDNADEREAAGREAEKILQAEAQGFRRQLMAERVVPTIVALRLRLDELFRQELDSFRQENGPFSKDQDEMLNALMSRMTQRIAGSLARELRGLPEKAEQEQMTTALRRLFDLQAANPAIGGAKSA